MSEAETEQSTEQASDQPTDQATDQPTDQGTGLPSVDAVVDSVGALDDRPVDEHVAVFEDAHEQLRRALDDAPEE